MIIKALFITIRYALPSLIDPLQGAEVKRRGTSHTKLQLNNT